MKRLLALLMCLMLVLSGAALAEEASEDTLVVGSTTRMSGDFFAGLWSANTADMDMRALLHDASTVAIMKDGNYNVNPAVVSGKEIYTDGVTDDSTTYTFTLRDGLKYSDGSAITAKDYVFSVLLLSAPQMQEIGGNNMTYAHLSGWKEYTEGQPFSGVRLLSENSFSLTIAGNKRPYYYELSLVNVTPYPAAVIAPGCDVADDGQGAYLTQPLTAAGLRDTLLNAETGYVSHPSVVSGPYRLVSYDAASAVAELEINENYMGNYEGQKPSIQKLRFQCVKNAEMISQLESGEIGLVNKVSSGAAIEAGKAAGLENTAYARNGLSYLAFACESGVGANQALRQAVAYCIEVQALCDEFLQGNGAPVYGYYGNGQWMAAQQQDALKQLNVYGKDLEKARALIQQAGYAADSNGKFVNLSFKLAVPAENAAAQALIAQLQESFDSLGVGLEVTELPMDELLKHLYRQTERTYDMFFLGSNFDYIFDPYYTFHTDDAYQGVANFTGLKDTRLMALAQKLRETPQGRQDLYKKRWLEFQQYWVEALPMVPLYSNTYVDFYRADLAGYDIASHSTWAHAIVYASLTK